MSAEPAPLILDGHSLTLADVDRFVRESPKVELAAGVRERLIEARKAVGRILESGEVVYGINTGFGRLSNIRIEPERLAELQRNLVMSHAAGTGPLVEWDAARLLLLLKANALASEHSGARPAVAEACCALLNAQVAPAIPEQGSVGASGDLAPLAHLALVLIGQPHAEILLSAGHRAHASEALKPERFTPVTLEAKEGLAILNGTQFCTALTALALLRALRLARAASITCALSTEAFQGSRVPHDPRISAARGQVGQAEVAAEIYGLLEDSALMADHAECDRVQDPYSFRCAPQVHGAVRDALRFAWALLSRELNAATDNPLLFIEETEFLSGGNFHAAPIALAADVIAIALTQLANIAERRIAQLIDPTFSGLPAFLIMESGVNSGFMLAQVTAAALVSEMKTLAHPASVDSIPTSAGKEDHVSMGAWAARKALQAATNCEGVLAIELLTACQGIDLRRPLTTSAPLEQVHAAVRQRVEVMERDRPLAPDIEALRPMLHTLWAIAKR